MSAKLRVGWICDFPHYVGGAELTEQYFRKECPQTVQVVPTAPGQIDPRCDIYVIHNCSSYSIGTMDAIRDKPIVKYTHDAWGDVDAGLRSEILGVAAAITFCSPLHQETFEWSYPADHAVLIPPPIDVSSCWYAKESADERSGVVWLGSMMGGNKGVLAAVRWAEEHETKVDFYGFGPPEQRPIPSDLVVDHGQIPAEDVPAILASYEKFLFLPTQAEPFGRCVAEAYFCGCQLILNERVGAAYWLNPDRHEAIFQSAPTFWQLVEQCA